IEPRKVLGHAGLPAGMGGGYGGVQIAVYVGEGLEHSLGMADRNARSSRRDGGESAGAALERPRGLLGRRPDDLVRRLLAPSKPAFLAEYADRQAMHLTDSDCARP